MHQVDNSNRGACSSKETLCLDWRCRNIEFLVFFERLIQLSSQGETLEVDVQLEVLPHKRFELAAAGKNSQLFIGQLESEDQYQQLIQVELGIEGSAAGSSVEGRGSRVVSCDGVIELEEAIIAGVGCR